MFKVMVERPRLGKERDGVAARLRDDFWGPMRLGMRAGYGYRSLNENLAPLRRYLRAQLGRPWNKVFSEICDGIDRRNTVQQHIHQHIRDFIAVDVEVRDGRPVDLRDRWRFAPRDCGIFQELYVDPRTGLIRLNKHYGSWRRHAAVSRKRAAAEIDARRRTVDERTLLLLLESVWYRVELGMLPEVCIVERVSEGKLPRRMLAEPRYDVVLRMSVARGDGGSEQRQRMYGSNDLYALGKRQISSREIKAHRLR